MANIIKHKTYIIVNPTAGDGQAEKRWKKFKNELKKNQIPYKAVITEYQNHATELVSEAISSDYNRIGVFSGDGTLNEVLQGLFAEDSHELGNIKLIFFPAGSSCDFEKKFKTPRSPIERIQADNSVSIDVFKVEYIDSSGKQMSRYIINNSKLTSLGFSPETSLENGINEIFDYLEKSYD